MSKRPPNSSNVSPAKKKRTKLQQNQSQLDHFFSSPKTKSTTNRSGPVQPEFVRGSSTKFDGSAPLTSLGFDKPEVIDVDSFDVEGLVPSPLPKSLAASDLSRPAPAKSKELNSSRVFGKVSTSSVPIVFLPLDVDPIAYKPNLQPSRQLEAPYALLTHALIALSQTRSRIAIINILTNFLRTITLKHPLSLLPAVYLLSNCLGPSFVPIELGLGSSILSRAIQQISGLSAAALKQLYNTTGDPGDVAYAAKSNIRTLIPHPPLTVPYVYESMLKIARCKGQGAAKEKQKIVEKLLLAASGEEVRYITRMLCQNLRVGAVRTSLLSALARTFVLTDPQFKGALAGTDLLAPGSPYVSEDAVEEPEEQRSPSKGKKKPTAAQEKLASSFKEAESLVKQVYVKHPSYDQIIPALLENGLDSLADRVPLTIGIPLHPMLGSPMRSLEEIYSRLGDLPFSAEFKYDGQRAQIHALRLADNKSDIKIFSRHLEDMTSKYPDIIGLVDCMFKESASLSSFIMDAEVVAVDTFSGAIKSFQELSGRARKDVNLKDIRIAVCVFAFDLMYLNGEPLLSRSFRDRRDLLRQCFPIRRSQEQSASVAVAQFDLVKSCESNEGKACIEDFMLSAVENRCEGLMIKLLDKLDGVELNGEKQGRLKSLPCTYEPDVRTSGWLKLKKDYMEGMGDSMDLIPVGAWYGNGRKAPWWSPVLLALWNPETGRPVAVCKCMSGFTDAFYTSMKEHYSGQTENCSAQPMWECDFGGFRPDVYFRPHEVWEIRGADVTESPVSIAAKGIVESSRGLSLRFPRFIRIKDDKNVELASTPSFLTGIWREQQGKAGHSGNDDGDLIDLHFGHSDLDYLSEEEENI
ncbi:DNA ligase [Gymnopilus junonius]|uniref:DNA ligase n=1 Tax=Gymnopilus junonius TaxID=109634 RepID=A0A9P5TQW7_GYMJU|nr:DNA ligase [Gymnopilus junonius]